MMLDYKVLFVGDLTITHSKERQKMALEVLDKHYAKVVTYSQLQKELEELAKDT